MTHSFLAMHFLRDSFTGDLHHFDPHLFDVLFDLTRVSGRPDAESAHEGLRIRRDPV